MRALKVPTSRAKSFFTLRALSSSMRHALGCVRYEEQRAAGTSGGGGNRLPFRAAWMARTDSGMSFRRGATWCQVSDRSGLGC